MEYVYLILELCGGLGAFLIGMELLLVCMSRLAVGWLMRLL